MAATNLQPAMVLLDMLEVRMGYPGRIAVQKGVSEVIDRFGQLRLVSLDGQQIVRPARFCRINGGRSAKEALPVI